MIRAVSTCLDHADESIAAAAARLQVAGLPGREGRYGQPMPASVDALIDELDQQAGPTIGPEVWIGHSWGALLASLCVHRRLGGACGVSDGAAGPVGLVVLNAAATDAKSDQSAASLDDGEFLDWIDRRYGGVPRAIRDDPKLAAIFLPALRGDFKLYEQYQRPPLPPLPVPIIAVGSTNDPAVDAAALHGWRSRTSAAFRTRMLNGDHFAPLQRPAAVLRLAASLLPDPRPPRVPIAGGAWA